MAVQKCRRCNATSPRRLYYVSTSIVSMGTNLHRRRSFRHLSCVSNNPGSIQPRACYTCYVRTNFDASGGGACAKVVVEDGLARPTPGGQITHRGLPTPTTQELLTWAGWAGLNGVTPRLWRTTGSSGVSPISRGTFLWAAGAPCPRCLYSVQWPICTVLISQ